ncbi:MAG: thymidine phosphorylase [Chloroflexi bacterium]|nr:thymidine phosphorylase [Chloroflexota bacterium]
MRAVEVIEKKRDGHELSTAEIDAFIDGYVSGKVADYQAAAWAMAVLLRGMTLRETVDLTMAMVRSGETLDLSSVAPRVVDKHSTGGVGDKTTLVVAPIVAAAGLPVVKMSGRGLGFSGGTLDKLESIPGLRVELSSADFLATVRLHGIAVVGQTANLVPADGKLYALRDVTGTVPSLPLIASSIMSKKIAGGADAIVLDVKVGRGAFMERVADARVLAELMIQIGQGVGRQVTALLSDMSQPLGYAIGNALEVTEAIDCLRHEGPPDLENHCLAVAAEMLLLGQVAESPEEAHDLARQQLVQGQALAKFGDWIAAQGGDTRVIDSPALLPQAPWRQTIVADDDGYVEQLDARSFGLACVELGGGRQRKEDAIDHSVGIVLHAKTGAKVSAGAPLYTLHARSQDDAERMARHLAPAVRLSQRNVSAPPLILDVLRG